MGQKVHPGGLRVGVIHDWKSNWYVGKKEFPTYILEDVRIRDHINGKLGHAGLSDILIRKDKQRITVDIYTARPGIVIGKSGVEVDALRKELHSITGKNVHININEIKRPELDAKLVAQSIAEQLQNRVSFRRAMKRSLASAMRSGAQGIKIQCGGRLGGGEMSRSERYTEGRIPLHTIRADIDYGFAEAKTTAGRIGVKVWINKGEIMPEGFEGMTDRQGHPARRPGSGAPQARRRGRGARRLPRERPRPQPGPRGPRPRQEDAPSRRQARWPRRPSRWASRRRAEPSRRRQSPAAGSSPGAGQRREAAHRRERRLRRGARAAGDRAAGRDDPGARRRRTRHDDAEAADRGQDEARRVRLRGQGRVLMLLPKKVKYRKVHRGRRRGMSRGQTEVQFGDWGIKALENGWLTNRQIEAARIAMTRKIKRGGKVWINVFPDKSVTQKPAETRMGSGKGSPEHWVAVIKPGRVMFELAGVPEPLAKEALRLAGQKLPIKTKIVKREADLFAS